MNWISWVEHPVPNDVHGILIKYSDGIFSDRYDEKGNRKYREGKGIIGWKFMERSDPNSKTFHPIANHKQMRDPDCDKCGTFFRM